MFNFKKFPWSSSLILKGDERLVSYRESPVYEGNPDALYFARDVQELSEILKDCNAKKVPVTFCGGRTSLTGASMADSGLLIALEKQSRLLDLGVLQSTGQSYARAEPGILLGEFKRQLLDADYFYPPDPTSLNEAQLGATVATNATGEDTFYYGPTRKYVRELKILTAHGDQKVVTREKSGQSIPARGQPGYLMDGELIDTIIGSEGTLGLITEVMVDVLPHPLDHFSLLIPFPGLKESLEFVVRTIHSQLSPRALELIGPGAFEIFSSQKGVPSFPEATQSLIYLKQDFEGEEGKEKMLTQWLQWLESFYRDCNVSGWSESIFLGDTSKQKDDIRKWRHYIPAIVNENARLFGPEGGGKISTDWWVPTDQILPVMLWAYAESQRAGVDFLVFGHIGNGHPHWNYLTKNAEEKRKVETLVTCQCRKVMENGGGLAGEHGVGKIHWDYLDLQYPSSAIRKMIELKKRWDPNWILGRGNIFSPPY